MEYIHNIELLLEVIRPVFNSDHDSDIEMYNLKTLKLNIIEVI